MSSWQPADKAEKHQDPFQVLLSAKYNLDMAISRIVQIRDRILEDDKTLSDLPECGWDIVSCPKCGWIGFRFQTFIGFRENAPGQNVSVEECGVMDCNEIVDTCFTFEDGTYVPVYKKDNGGDLVQ